MNYEITNIRYPKVARRYIVVELSNTVVGGEKNNCPLLNIIVQYYAARIYACNKITTQNLIIVTSLEIKGANWSLKHGKPIKLSKPTF